MTVGVLDFPYKGLSYQGLSTDEKPEGVSLTSRFFEIDTKKTYSWEGSQWVDITPTGGSGDMLKSTYDPNADGVIALAQLDSGVSIFKQADHDALANPHHSSANDLTTGEKTGLTGGGQTALHSHAGGSQAFPVGSVFLAVVNTDPATLLGYGSWTQIAQGQFLVGQKTTDADFDVAEETGGAKTHTHTGHSAHVVTQPSDHAAQTHSGGAVGTIVATATAAVKIGTAGATGAAQTHTHPAPAFTQPGQHPTLSHANAAVDAHSAHDTPSHLPPYLVVYVWKRTA